MIQNKLIEMTQEELEKLNSCIETSIDPNSVDIVKETTIRELKVGEFFKYRLNDKTVWVRGKYDRSDKSYEIIGHNTNAVRATYCRNGSRKVYIGFTY